MKKLLLSSAVLATFALFTACGDDSSSGPEEESSSSIEAEDKSSSSVEEEGKSSAADKKSSSSEAKKGDSSSSIEATSSSGEAKSSSSIAEESSSSNVIASSSGAKQSSSSEEATSSSEEESSSSVAEESSSSNVIASSSGAKQSSSSEEDSSSSEESSSSANGSSSSVADAVCYGEYGAEYTCVTTRYLNQDMLDTNGYGEFVDIRDKQVYKTVKICNDDKSFCQTWMAQNLNYAPKNVSDLGKYPRSGCYENKASNCAKYGRLYTWEVAMDKADCGYRNGCDNSNEGTQGVCPAGWHLPTYEEWQTLFENAGKGAAGRMLRSEDGWRYHSESTKSINYYGFSAVAAGGWGDGGILYDEGAYFWSSSERGVDKANYMYLYYYDESANLGNDSKNDAFSVRCIKD